MTPSVGAAREWLGRWLGRLIVLCAVGTCINFAGLAIALLLISDQAGQGAEARDRQNQVFPVSCKLYVDARTRGVISERDLRVFETPQRCPRPK